MKHLHSYQTVLKYTLILLIVGALVGILPILFMVDDLLIKETSLATIIDIKHTIDKHKEISIDDILNDDQLISEATTNPTHFGHNPHTIWLKIIVENPFDQPYNWVFSTQNNHLLSAKLYELIAKNNQYSYKILYQHGYPRIQNLPYFSPTLSTQIAFKAKERKVLYLQYHSLMSTHLHLDFFSLDEAKAINIQGRMVLGVVITILMTLIFTNLVFYFSLRKKQYLYYCLQELFVIFIFLANAGYSMYYFHPDNAAYTPIVNFILTLLTIAITILFIDAFLNIKLFLPRQRIIVFSYIALSFILIGFSFIPVMLPVILQYITPVFVGSSIVLAFILGCYAVYKQHYYAIPFCLAWFILIVSIGITLLSMMDIYHINIINHIYPSYFGYISEGMLLSLAMGLQIAKLRKEHEQGGRKLMSIYQERAIEIQELQTTYNEKISAIKEMNSKTKHLASASHDINHSLFLLKLNLEALKNDRNVKEIQNTYASLNYLEEITDNILIDSKCELDKAIGQVNIRPLFQSIDQELSTLATRKGLQLRYRAADIVLDGSTVILKRILENLVRNAVQHTHHGGVLFAIRERATHYSIQVFDTGSGIKKEKMQSIQKAFTQGEVGNQGYGLGLYIVSVLCKQSAYDLSIVSKINKGSVFTIKIKKAYLYL